MNLGDIKLKGLPMAYQPKQLTKDEVFNTLKNFHENQIPSLPVSKANVPLMTAFIKKSKYLVMNVFPNGSAQIIRKTS